MTDKTKDEVVNRDNDTAGTTETIYQASLVLTSVGATGEIQVKLEFNPPVSEEQEESLDVPPVYQLMSMVFAGQLLPMLEAFGEQQSLESVSVN